MKSTIRVDFKGLDGLKENAFEPVIRVNLEDSEDVRDSLLKALFQGTEYLKITYFQHDSLENNSRIILEPVKQTNKIEVYFKGQKLFIDNWPVVFEENKKLYVLHNQEELNKFS